MNSIAATLGQGLPVLAGQFLVTLALLGAGIAVYMLITPFSERRLVREGNVAAGVVIAATLVSLALPLAATLATSFYVLDIVIWGAVALVIQLVVFLLTVALFPGFRGMIEAGNIGAALVLAGLQLAVALLNAAAVSG